MPDTARADFADAICSDCGIKGCTIRHWGDAVLPGEIGYFCEFCWQQRSEAADRGEVPKPLGVKPPSVPEELLGKSFSVTTASGSVYELSPSENGEIWLISRRRRPLPFKEVQTFLLKVGQPFYLRYREDDEWYLFRTTPVVSIEPKK